MAANIAVYEFTKVLASGDVLEPNYLTGNTSTLSEDGYLTQNKCEAVQIIADGNVRLTTDGTQPNALSRYLAANQLATVIYVTPAQYHLKFIDA